MVMGVVCLKFPGNDAVRTEYDYSGGRNITSLRHKICLAVSLQVWFLICSCGSVERTASPVDNSNQIILVIAGTDFTHKGKCFAFNRTGRNWQKAFSFPVVIGKNGLGWGLGLHDNTDSDPSEPVKREGDGKSPMGVFELIHVYGYLSLEVVDTRFPYTKSDKNLICIDDTENDYYNMVVNLREKGLDADSLPSHEDMVRRDDLYKYTIFVGHNINEPRRGAGSCIFLHLWAGEDSHTAGCTAMSEQNMVRLLAWLDPDENPVFVQLTRKSYMRLQDRWGLPDIL